MTQDEIIRMFHEAGELAGWKPGVGNPLVINYLTHFAALAFAAGAAHEREACAKVVETDGVNLCEGDKDMQRMYSRNKVWRDHYAAAIRARSNNAT